VEDHSPIVGVVYAPLRKLLYFAHHHLGAFKLIDPASFDEHNLLESSTHLPFIHQREKFTVVGSRSHMNDETTKFINKLEAEHGGVEIISSGSALKLCQVAEGSADIYPRFAPTMEWDTAAGQAIVELSGGSVTNPDGSGSLIYNKQDLLNPWFIVRGQ
jgi:3'(2'), 5'-bisphosphate nucleotidase